MRKWVNFKARYLGEGKYLPWRNSCFTSYRKFKMKRMKRMVDRNVDPIKMNYFETMMAKEYSIRYSRCIISAGMVCCLHGLAVSWQLLQWSYLAPSLLSPHWTGFCPCLKVQLLSLHMAWLLWGGDRDTIIHGWRTGAYEWLLFVVRFCCDGKLYHDMYWDKCPM